MNYFPFVLFSVLILIAIQYLLEVQIGSSTSMYDGESGVVSAACLPKKSTRSQFVGKMVPLQLMAIGAPLLAYDLRSGVILFLIALLLFGLYRKQSPARAHHPAST